MYAKPEKVEGEIPQEFIASQNEQDLKTDIIPLPKKGQWLQIDYYDYPTGNVPKVWRMSNNRIADLERQAKAKEKKGEPVSVASFALQIEEMYLDSSIRYMVKRINNKPVTPNWFEQSCNDSLRKILQTWRKAGLECEDYEYPEWAKPPKDDTEENNEDDSPNEEPPTSPIVDLQVSSGPMEEGVIIESFKPSEQQGTTLTI